MKKTFYSYSFGCRVNQAEKESLDSELCKLGYSYKTENPNIYIINTCAVTNKAEREARQLIYKVKKTYPDTKIVVTGCAATNWIKKRISIEEIDFLVDNKNKEYLASIIDKKNGGGVKSNTISEESTKQITNKYITSGRMMIKIQDGCQRFCSFCIVPYLRGLPVSHRIEKITGTINDQKDLREAVLVAINTEAFGYDTKETFLQLIEAVFKNTTVPRLSFGSVHPWSVNAEYIEWYQAQKENTRLVKFFHIPLQSGSDKMLKLMKRGYTRDEYMEKLKAIEAVDRFSFIGTDIIAGFLDETDADFADTYNFLEESPISKFHVFRYSERSHTAAYYMKKRLSEPTSTQKSERSKKLIALGNKKYEKFLQTHIEQSFDALFLEKREGDWQQVLLSNQVPAAIKTDRDRTGEILSVRIRSCKNARLFGTIS